MEIQGKITNTSFRSGKRSDGSTWEAVDYWIVEQGVRFGSEFQFSMFGDNMKAYALRKGAEGKFAFRLSNQMKNGFSRLEVALVGFDGTDHDREGNEVQKCLGVFAAHDVSASGQETSTESPDSNDLPY